MSITGPVSVTDGTSDTIIGVGLDLFAPVELVATNGPKTFVLTQVVTGARTAIAIPIDIDIGLASVISDALTAFKGVPLTDSRWSLKWRVGSDELGVVVSAPAIYQQREVKNSEKFGGILAGFNFGEQSQLISPILTGGAAVRTYAVLDSNRLHSDVDLPDPLTLKPNITTEKGAISDIPLQGKVYFEAKLVSGSPSCRVGIATTAFDPAVMGTLDSNNGTIMYLPSQSSLYIGGLGKRGDTLHGQVVVGDVIGMFFDADLKTIWVSVNGVVSSGDPAAGTGGYVLTGDLAEGPYYAVFNTYWGSSELDVNFGEGGFDYAPVGDFGGAYAESALANTIKLTESNGKATGFFDGIERTMSETVTSYIWTAGTESSPDGKWRARDVVITPFSVSLWLDSESWVDSEPWID